MNQTESNLSDNHEQPPAPNSRIAPNAHLIFLIGVVVTIVLVVLGWLYFTKKSFERIDQRLEITSPQSTEQAIDEFTATLKQAGQMIEQAEQEITQIKEKNEEQKQQAEELHAAGQIIADNLSTADVE